MRVPPPSGHHSRLESHAVRLIRRYQCLCVYCMFTDARIFSFVYFIARWYLQAQLRLRPISPPQTLIARFFLPSLRREDSPPGRAAAAAAVVPPIDSCQANLLRAQHLGVGGRSRSARNYKFEGDLHRWFTHPSAKYACDIARR